MLPKALASLGKPPRCRRSFGYPDRLPFWLWLLSKLAIFCTVVTNSRQSDLGRFVSCAAIMRSWFLAPRAVDPDGKHRSFPRLGHLSVEPSCHSFRRVLQGRCELPACTRLWALSVVHLGLGPKAEAHPQSSTTRRQSCAARLAPG